MQSVIDEHLEGTPDAQLLDACRSESRLLITLDLDFADIRAYPPSGHAGIWVCGRTLRISKPFSPCCVEHLRCSPGNLLNAASGSWSVIACGFETNDIVDGRPFGTAAPKTRPDHEGSNPASLPGRELHLVK